MGFNKRIIDKDTLQHFKSQSLQKLIDYLTKPDCVILQDNFSESVTKLVRQYKSDEETLKQKLIDFGFYESK